MAKKNLVGEFVLQRDSLGKLWLMNRSGGSLGSRGTPVASEEAFLSEYNVRLGEWTQGDTLEFCPVIPLRRDEMPTVREGDLDGKASLTPEQYATFRKSLDDVVVDGEVLREATPEEIHARFTEGMKPVVIIDGPNVLTGYSLFGDLETKPSRE